jgi:farnesyl diphosphate synthase
LTQKRLDISSRIASYQSHVELALERSLPRPDLEPRALHEAMRYAILGGGKRMRPLLVYAVGETLGANLNLLDAPAIAVEMIHAYSLIHDDLPAMDDDDLRRGKPSCHIVYGDAIAILAGDALQALAFDVLARDSHCSANRRLKMLSTLAVACGSVGMAGGQAIDLAAVGHQLDEAGVRRMHLLKTAALIQGSVLMGAIAAGCHDGALFHALSSYGLDLGLAFQIHDDILDIEGDTAVIGKPQGSDAARGKPTYPAAIGLERSRIEAKRLMQQAIRALEPFGNKAKPMADLARYTVERAV